MTQIQCQVIAAPNHADWLQSWSRQATPTPGVRLLTERANRSGRRADAVLMLVGDDSLGWARSVLDEQRAGFDPVLAVTRHLEAPAIADLLRLGAGDFVGCNCDPEELRLRLSRLTEGVPLAQAQAQTAAPPRHPLLSRLIGQNARFLQQLGRIPRIAGCDAGVLILGETGTGKELCAQAIHYMSARAGHPWVAVNCGALPAELVEDELFGHARGAYTSAHQARRGLIGEAEGGTLFLDEIDSMPLPSQAKLLRFLQEKEYRPVGSSRCLTADVRVIAACNQDLDLLAEQGRFRRDLFYRLNVLTVCLPPLRERLDDLPPLVEHFMRRFADDFGVSPRGLSPSVLARLAAHHWPGNVRELEHMLERAVLLCAGGTIDASDLELQDTPSVQEGEVAESFSRAKAQVVGAFECEFLKRMLKRHAGNISHAAQACGKDRRAFWQLMRKHAIDATVYHERADEISHRHS